MICCDTAPVSHGDPFLRFQNWNLPWYSTSLYPAFSAGEGGALVGLRLDRVGPRCRRNRVPRLVVERVLPTAVSWSLAWRQLRRLVRGQRLALRSVARIRVRACIPIQVAQEHAELRGHRAEATKLVCDEGAEGTTGTRVVPLLEAVLVDTGKLRVHEQSWIAAYRGVVQSI